jgi:hypothetical protein
LSTVGPLPGNGQRSEKILKLKGRRNVEDERSEKMKRRYRG